MSDEIKITVIATGFEDQDQIKTPGFDKIGGFGVSSNSKPWEKKTSSIPSNQDLNSSSNDLDIPSFLRKNKAKNI